MHNFSIKSQIKKLYLMTTVSYFRIASASWVALLTLRGFSLVEIGLLESIFHIVSFCFELPSGVFADVFGRKKTLIMSKTTALVSSLFMIISNSFLTTALAIGLSALSYNLESGTLEALAYDSLKEAGQEKEYNRFSSTDMVIYRITNSSATLCAGLALWLGFRKAYTVDIIFELAAIFITFSLTEINVGKKEKVKNTGRQIKEVITGSIRFLKVNKRVRLIITVNAFIGAVATLVLFFLQAKLPEAGLAKALLGPALFFMGLGAACGARLSSFFTKSRYRKLLVISGTGVVFSFLMIFTGHPFSMIAGGFIGALADDFLEVKTDVILNNMIPSEQRATLVSVNSFIFSLVMIFMSTFMGWIIG